MTCGIPEKFYPFVDGSNEYIDRIDSNGLYGFTLSDPEGSHDEKNTAHKAKGIEDEIEPRINRVRHGIDRKEAPPDEVTNRIYNRNSDQDFFAFAQWQEFSGRHVRGVFRILHFGDIARLKFFGQENHPSGVLFTNTGISREPSDLIL
jgi:hypothetical protein